MLKQVLLILHSVLFINAQEFSAGQETHIPWPDTVNKHIKVFLPENYSSEKKWPVIFYFHGMNGKPGTGLFQKYTAKKDFIIVSMDYCVKGTQRFASVKESRAYYQKEFNNILKVKNAILPKVSIDPQKTFLAGVSKGGWICSVIAESHLSSFAGVIIFLAGKMGGPERPVIAPNRANIPIYVGVGEKDGNFIAGVAAGPHFKKFKADVNLEIFDGLGHEMPKTPPAIFKEWLNKHRPDIKVNLDQWLETMKNKLQQDDPKELLKAYRELKEHPLLFKLSKNQRTSYVAELNRKLKASPKFFSEFKAYLAYFKALELETKARKPQDWEKAIKQMTDLQKNYPGTDYALKAANQIERASKVLEKARAYFKRFEK